MALKQDWLIKLCKVFQQAVSSRAVLQSASCIYVTNMNVFLNIYTKPSLILMLFSSYFVSHDITLQ